MPCMPSHATRPFAPLASICIIVLAATLLVPTIAARAAGPARAPAAAPPAGSFRDIRFLDLTPVERDALSQEKLHDNPPPYTPYNTQQPRESRRHQVFVDRNEYYADDPVGQAMICFIGAPLTAKTRLQIELVRLPAGSAAAAATGGAVVWKQEIASLQSPKISLIFDTAALSVGSYQLQARLLDCPGAWPITPCFFTKSDQRYRKVAFPQDGVPLMVMPQQEVPDATWPITTGIPMPRGIANDPAAFTLLEDGQPAPAQFTSRGSWYPDGSQLRWLGLDFQARYRGGKPAQYRLVLGRASDKSAASPLRLTSSDQSYTIDTGKIRLVVLRQKFDGIHQAALVGPDGAAGGELISPGGGPFLVDSRGFRFSSAHDQHSSVIVEEQGPLRITLYASGWYVADAHLEKLCLYQTRITAYANQNVIDVSQRTVITYDTDKQKLQDLGFALPHAAVSNWSFGGDGKTLAGAFPAADPAAKTQPEVFLHQDRYDHFRVVDGDKAAGEGARSDGWTTAGGPAGNVSLLLRNIWQMFPKEIRQTPQELALHVWPRHGKVSFSSAEEFAWSGIYKLFYAHQGQFLDLKFPQSYFQKMQEIGQGPMLEKQDINALAGNGQGLATTAEFRIVLSPAAPPDAVAAAHARLFQQNPHAIASPQWNAASDVMGRFAPVDREHFPNVEFTLDDGYRANTTTPDILNEYGMWIWPDTHNNWSPVSRLPEWHRIWNLGHYQNVGESWLLYLRSGYPWAWQWARENTRHFQDVGTVNYDDPDHPLLGHIAGSMYHTKGFTPWGSPKYGDEPADDYVEVGAHFVNPAAFVFRWEILGDHNSWNLARTWMHALGRAALPPERSRECNTTLGELMACYQASFDPQLLPYIRDLNDEHQSWPWMEIPNPSHALFSASWARRVWEYTRSPAVKERVLQFIAPKGDQNKPGNWCPAEISALAYQMTGDTKYLQWNLPGLAIWWQHFYNNPADPLHGYGPRLGYLGSNCDAQRTPYFLQAVLDAGLTVPTDDAGTAVPVLAVTRPQKDALFVVAGGPSNYGSACGFIHVEGAAPVLTLTANALVYRNNNLLPEGTGASFVRIVDAAGKTLLEQTILGGSQRPSVSLEIDARQMKLPLSIYRNAYGCQFSWTGSADALVLGPTAESVQPAKK